VADNVGHLSQWFVRPPGAAPYGPLTGNAVIEGILRGSIPGASYVCPLGDNTWLPATSIPTFRRIIKSASIPTLRPVEVSNDDETPTPVRPLASSFAPRTPTTRAAFLPPLPSLERHSPAEIEDRPRRPRFWVAALVSVLFGGALGATAWLVHDGSRMPPESSLAGVSSAPFEPPPAAPPASTAVLDSERTTSRPPSAPRRLGELLGDVRAHSICQDPAGRDNGICGWIVAIASDQPAVQLSLPGLQKALMQKGIFQAELTVLGEPDEAGRIPVRLYGDFGYCFEPKRAPRREARLIAWVERRRAIRTAGRTCVILEEVPAVETLVELTKWQGTDRAPALAETAVGLLSQSP
jgi:hypothetical protein